MDESLTAAAKLKIRTRTGERPRRTAMRILPNSIVGVYGPSSICISLGTDNK